METQFLKIYGIALHFYLQRWSSFTRFDYNGAWKSHDLLKIQGLSLVEILFVKKILYKICSLVWMLWFQPMRGIGLLTCGISCIILTFAKINNFLSAFFLILITFFIRLLQKQMLPSHYLCFDSVKCTYLCAW